MLELKTYKKQRKSIKLNDTPKIPNTHEPFLNLENT